MRLRSFPTLTPCVLLAALLAIPANHANADDEIFELSELPTSGRVVAARFADFDGDGRKDLLLATLAGIPPSETRSLHIYAQGADGHFPDTPTRNFPIPQWSAVFDVADLRDNPGMELVLLRPHGVTILSLAESELAAWDLPVDGPSTIAASDDERGFEALTMVHRNLTDEPLILVPQIGLVTALDADGNKIAEFEVGRRANYYVTESSGFVAVESEIQLFLDVPKLSVVDVNGDSRTDLVAATRHEIRVFLQLDDGGFAREASYSLALGFINAADHSRGSGSIVSTIRDIDNDGRADLMISHIEGTFSKTETTTYIYRNKDERWNLDEPDDTYVSKGTLSSDLLFDLDDDGEYELVRVQFRFSILEMVEMLLTREFDVWVNVHKLGEDGQYEEEPWSRRKISTAMDFDTFRPKGFMPTGGLDLNGDGLMDFITSADGKGIEVFLGDRRGYSRRRSAIQRFDSAGEIRLDDYDGDGLPDFVLYVPQRFDNRVRIGRNLGTLAE